jgi:polyphosphate kinase
MSTPQPQDATERPVWNLDSPELYLNRELTWLAFNSRVLHEAEDERTPLLERLKFIAIVSSNLDEFFMKRIGGLKQQRGAGVSSLTVDGRTPERQIAEANRVVRELDGRITVCLEQVLAKLAEHDVRIVDYLTLKQADQSYLREHFFDNIFPLMTPQAIDPAHPFPFVSNLSLNLLVTVRLPGELGKISLARIKVPVGGDVPRFLKLHDANHFVPLEQVVIHNMDMLLPGVEVLSCEMFRVTRNANTERAEEQADDLLVMIESELRDRRFAPIVRLQVQVGMDPVHRGMLAAELALD